MKNTVSYTIHIEGLSEAPGTISIKDLMPLLQGMVEGSLRALRLNIEGESIRRGKPPRWVSDSVNFLFTGLKEGSTEIVIEAPLLKETATSQIQQKEFWINLPEPEETAFSVLCKSVQEILSEDLESDYYDKGVLEALLIPKHIFQEGGLRLSFSSKEREKDHFQLGLQEYNKIENLKASTPDPQTIVVSGIFDMIEYSAKRFKLKLESGEWIRGTATSSLSTETMKEFWGQKATLRGTGYFKSSGNLRFVEADLIKVFEAGEELFGNLPQAELPVPEIEQVWKKLGQPEEVFQKIWGKWPGDETIEELLGDLKGSNS